MVDVLFRILKNHCLRMWFRTFTDVILLAYSFPILFARTRYILFTTLLGQLSVGTFRYIIKINLTHRQWLRFYLNVQAGFIVCVLHIFSRYIRQGHFHVQNAFVLGWPSLFKYANRKVKIMCICVVQNQIEKMSKNVRQSNVLWRQGCCIPARKRGFSSF